MKCLQIEVAAAFFIIVSVAGVGSLLLQSTWHQYQLTQTLYRHQLSAYALKKLAKKQDDATTALLQHWRQQSPQLYAAMTASSTADQRLTLLTQLIQESGFTIMRASSLHFVLSGHYADLFELIDRMDQSPWPIDMISLSIVSAKQFDIQFAIRGVRD